jgi:DNA-binding HxlR family transcriptional regulator
LLFLVKGLTIEKEKEGREMSEELSPYCARYSRAVEIIGRRWTGGVLRALLSGRTRFNEIAAIVPGLSDRLLSERLKELEDEGIVVRNVTACRPVRIDYELTVKGRALEPVVNSVAEWAENWLSLPPGLEEALRTR